MKYLGKYLHSISTLSCIVFVNSIRRAAGNSILANAANYKCSKCVMTQRNSKLQISGALKRPLFSKFFNMKNFYKARAILLFTMDYFFQLFQWRHTCHHIYFFIAKNTRASSNYYYLHLSYYGKKVEKYTQYTHCVTLDYYITLFSS